MGEGSKSASGMGEMPASTMALKVRFVELLSV